MTVPVGVIRPILFALNSVNQRLPSGPAVIPDRFAPAVMPLENSVTAPPGVIRPMRFPVSSVNQTLPSGPAAIRSGAAPDGEDRRASPGGGAGVAHGGRAPPADGRLVDTP